MLMDTDDPECKRGIVVMAYLALIPEDPVRGQLLRIGRCDSASDAVRDSHRVGIRGSADAEVVGARVDDDDCGLLNGLQVGTQH